MATFAEVLRYYLQTIDCSAKELADASHISPSGISRYLSANRVPPKGSSALPQLATGIAQLAHQQQLDSVTEEEVLATLMESIGGTRTDISLFSAKLRQLIEALGISYINLARSSNFDPSYISRIVAGQRHPKDLEGFVHTVSSYISRNYNDLSSLTVIAELTGHATDELESRQDLEEVIRNYLLKDIPQPATPAISGFLENLDKFDLNDYLKSMGFADIPVPEPSNKPSFSTKTYHGIAGSMEAELDFLMAAATSEAAGDIILYSDFPIAQIPREDASHAGKIMAGIATLLKKGFTLSNIHNLHRPFNEVVMGLEGWLPIYMTGQVTPYYLPHPTNHEFLHFLRSAPDVCMSGEGVSGFPDNARYFVSCKPDDVSYLRQRGQDLLDHAKPLFRIFFEKDEAKCQDTIDRLVADTTVEPMEVGKETFQNMTLTVWPGSHAVVRKLNDPRITMVIDYLPLVDAMARYEPQLFA